MPNENSLVEQYEKGPLHRLTTFSLWCDRHRLPSNKYNRPHTRAGAGVCHTIIIIIILLHFVSDVNIITASLYLSLASVAICVRFHVELSVESVTPYSVVPHDHTAQQPSIFRSWLRQYSQYLNSQREWQH